MGGYGFNFREGLRFLIYCALVMKINTLYVFGVLVDNMHRYFTSCVVFFQPLQE